MALRAANDELTIRVAELLEENERLQAFVEKALIAQSNNKSVSVGCNPQELRRVLVTGSGSNSTAKKWIDANQANCTKQELSYIYKNINGWSGYPMGDSIRLVRYYMDQK